MQLVPAGAIEVAAMRALQIVDLSGPDERAAARRPARARAVAHAHAGQRRASSTCTPPACRSPRCCRRAASTSSSRRCRSCPAARSAASCAARPTARRLSAGDRVAACCMLGGFAEVAVAPDFLTFPLPDELDFAQGAGLILNYHTAYFSLKLRGRLAEGETRARPRRGGRRRHRGAAGRQGPGRAHDRGRLHRREGAGRARGRRRRGRALRRAVEGRGQGALGRRRRRGPRPGRRRPLHRQPALAARGRPARRRRLHRRLDPRGQGQPPAAQQHRGRRRRLGRLRDGQARRSTARSAPRSSRSIDGRVRAADRRRALPARGRAAGARS